MELGIAGKNALVTGGSRGVGRAVTVALAREGVNVAVGYHSTPTHELTDECRALGVRAVGIEADLADESATTALIDAACEQLGPLDILINNAGVWPTNKVLETPIEEWRQTLDVNLTAPFLLSRAFAASALHDGRRATILNVTSQAAFNGSTTGHAHYAASKAALDNFTLSFARELGGGSGITVNAIALGIVETDMVEAALAQRREFYENRTIIGRIASPEEIAQIMLFLVSERAAYLTGSVFDATGGMISL